MLYLQKGNFQKLVRRLAGSWMSANMATAFGVVFIVLTAAAFYVGLTVASWRFLLLLAPVFLLFRMAMNALDGMLAREYGTGTVAGEICNETLDIVGDTVCYGILYFVPGFPTLSLVLFILLAWAAEFFGVLGKGMPGGIRRHETFLGGKPDRAVWMGLLSVILYVFPAFLAHSSWYLSIASLFVLLTCIIRVRRTLGAAEGKPYESYTWIGR